MLRQFLFRFRIVWMSFVISLGLILLFLVPLANPAAAQSPYPNFYFYDVAPGSTSVPAGAGGVVVEGLGSNSCTFSLSSIETSTVYWLQNGYYTWTEISPQTVCDSLSGYETMVQDIISYVDSNASNAGSLWNGIMLDEESNFDFSVSDLESLNASVANDLSGSTFTWWSTEDFSAINTWSQSDYISIVSDSYPAPQISTSYMVTLVNSWESSYGVNQIVTWCTTYPSPYNSESASVDAINGSPFYQGGSYWDNEYVNV